MNKVKASWLRHKKQKPARWVARHVAARSRAWAILSSGPATASRFYRFERNLDRLLRLQPPWQQFNYVFWSTLTMKQPGRLRPLVNRLRSEAKP